VRVLICLDNKDFGGPSVNAVQLSAALKARGHDVGLVVSRLDSPTQKLLDAPRSRLDFVAAVPMRRPSRGGWGEQARFTLAFPRDVARMSKVLRSWTPDVVHTMTTGELAAMLAARVLGVPLLAHIREIFSRPRIVVPALYRTIGRLATTVAAVSPAVERHLVTAGVPRTKLVVIENGIDYGLFHDATPVDLRAQLGIRDDAKILGMVGQLNPWKGHRLAIGALADLQEDMRTHLVIVGEETRAAKRDGYVRTLQADAAAVGVADRVHLVGFQAQRERYLRAFDVLLQPSIEPDPFPTTVLEAFAAGVPVIGSALGGIPDQLGSGDRGIVLDELTASGVSRAVRALVRDARRVERLTRAASAYAANRSWDQTADRVEHHYQTVISRGRTRR
jgi:glycosyltransferase involved in cell wall biosynthesis